MLRVLLPLVYFSLLVSSAVNAQSHKDHWYFGVGSGIRFENGEPKADLKGKTSAYIGSVSMSDSSGNLLFYTNGRAFFNKNHVEMPGSKGPNSAFSIDVIAVPSTQEIGIYFVYVVENYNIDIYKVDMQKDGGFGDVTHIGGMVPDEGYFVEITTVIKNCASNSYWLLSVHRLNDSYDLVSYEIDMSSGLISENTSLPIDEDIRYVAWDMVTSSNGKYVALVTASSVHLIEFDPNCGKFIGSTFLDLPQSDLTPRGACFSPNDAYLYLTYTAGNTQKEGWIYQIDYKNLANPNLYENFEKTDYSLYTMLNGPDNRLYILTHFVRDNMRMIDRVENPDAPWTNNSYKTEVVGFPNGAFLPFLPNFINDSRDCSDQQSPKLANTSFCVDDSASLQLSSIDGYDSIFLIDRSIGTYYAMNSSSTISLPKKPSGIHNYELVWRLCGARPGEKEVEVRIFDYPEIQNFDTIICTDDSFSLPPTAAGLLRKIDIQDNGQWLPYSRDFLTKKGQYRTELKNEACTSIDSFTVDITPPLLTSLGDSFSFCEKEGIPIILDAGKGFEGYRWHPTKDSTQWIQIRRQGDYYVVVNDSRGCTGRGDAKVYSDCTPTIYLPNAFSPDGNGLNDSFYVNGQYIVPLSMQVYDRWGAIVHFGKGSALAWNGTKNGETMPVGMYLYILTYKEEFTNKSHTISGPIHLLK